MYIKNLSYSFKLEEDGSDVGRFKKVKERISKCQRYKRKGSKWSKSFKNELYTGKKLNKTRPRHAGLNEMKRKYI